jgi:hypothetical protein
MTVTGRMVVVTAVVMSSLYGLRRQDLIQIFAVVVAGPLLNNLEHVVVHFAVRISECWVVENTHAVVQDLVDRYIWVVPRVYNARRNILQDRHSDLTGRRVQDV